eukprot:COSAG06_NODE_27032_length_602_cov_3.377734_2_plen_80_part_01
MLLSAASPAPCQTKHIAPSPIASPMLIVMKPKKDPLDPPKYRAVVDYRRANEYLKPLSYRTAGAATGGGGGGGAPPPVAP